MKRNIILLIMGIIILNIAGAIFYHHKMKEKVFRMMNHRYRYDSINPDSIDRIELLLELGDEQVEKIKKIELKYSEFEKPYHERIEPLREKLKVNILKDNIDENGMRSILEKIDNERRELRILNHRQRIEMEKILNIKQKKKLKELIKEFPGKFRCKGFIKGKGRKRGLLMK